MILEVSHKRDDAVNMSNSKIFVDFIAIDANKSLKQMFLMLDTGAFITVLDKKRAEEYGYKIHQEKGCEITCFGGKGLACDLRIIPEASFCGYSMENVLIATPHEDNIPVMEVLGMNVLENFNFSLDFDKNEIDLGMRENFISQRPKYRCGKVKLFKEAKQGPMTHYEMKKEIQEISDCLDDNKKRLILEIMKNFLPD